MTYTINHDLLLNKVKEQLASGKPVNVICQESGICKDFFYNMLKGKKRTPQLATIKRLCKYLNLETEQVIEIN